MLTLFINFFEAKKELLVCFTLSLLYVTYYLVEVVKKPLLVCAKGEFRLLLEDKVPILSESYWPTPWCFESRLHTVVASVLRSQLLPVVEYERQVLRLSDGGQVALDWAVEAGGAGVEGRGRPVLLVVPGLTGDSQADYVRCLVAAARAIGARAVVFNNRGIGGLPLTTPRLYSAVSHEDVAEAVAAAGARGGPVLLAGVSLGGLQVARLLAERGAAAGVRGALAVSPPLDVERGAACIARAANAPLSWLMARRLRAVAARLPAPPAAAARCRSVRAFDDAFTAPHFGFASADHYYRAASLRDRLAAVRVPLLCLCAADDPFQPLAALPLAQAASSARVALAVAARGGHIGFLEGWWPRRDPAAQYIARLAAQYFSALLAEPSPLEPVDR
ncbi:protein ABHD1 [Leptidea sinapis]|uniref:protein ABHD1 n=1 Tax=Leptidea sinapis TaxID=189913 RepID=UPI0021C3892C|nr:protein ABHD1 [Leptidea sinapis]